MVPALRIILLIVAVIVVLAIHELGHYVCARLCKVNVKEYSLGVGPRLGGFTTKRGMRVSFRPLPIAAYVLVDSKELRELYSDAKDERKRAFFAAPPPEGFVMIDDVGFLKKILIYVGGVLFNVIAFGVFAVILLLVTNNQVDYGTYLANWFEYLGRVLGFQETGGASIVGSSVGIVRQGEVAINYGRSFLGYLTAVNLTVAILNCLPLPPLDGFKMVVVAIEKANRKPLSARFKKVLSYATLFFAAYFLIAIITSDIRAIVN